MRLPDGTKKEIYEVSVCGKDFDTDLVKNAIQHILETMLKKDELKIRVEIQKNITRGDRIRSMSNEELAEFHVTGFCCPDSIRRYMCSQDDISEQDCKKCWLDFLNEELKEKEE